MICDTFMGKFSNCSIYGLVHNCSGILYNANKLLPATKMQITNTKIFIVGCVQLFAIRYQNKKPIYNPITANETPTIYDFLLPNKTVLIICFIKLPRYIKVK